MEYLKTEMAPFSTMEELFWCQEEPQNQGAWFQIRHRFMELLGDEVRLEYAGRPMSASPAVGTFWKHAENQKQVVDTALGLTH
jgi:2-oxoglutarate dehydrogenase E1 component